MNIAFLLWLGVSVWLTALTVTTLIGPESPRQPAGRPAIPQDWAAHPEQVSADAAYSAGLIIGRLLPLIVGVVVIVVALRMRAGSHRARITLTVIGVGLALLLVMRNVVPILTGGFRPILLLIPAGVLALLVAAILLMFRPRAGGFFR